MAAIEDFSDDFPQYLADTARELAESARRSLRKLEEESVIIAGLERRAELAAETLRTAASGLSEISGGLRDFNDTSYEAANRAIEALIQFREESKDDMRRMAEMSDMLAAFLSASRDEESGPGDEDPE